jgi:hypothetical protein
LTIPFEQIYEICLEPFPIFVAKKPQNSGSNPNGKSTKARLGSQAAQNIRQKRNNIFFKKESITNHPYYAE